MVVHDGGVEEPLQHASLAVNAKHVGAAGDVVRALHLVGHIGDGSAGVRHGGGTEGKWQLYAHRVSKRPWVWLTILTITSTLVLTLGTIAANRLHQSVEWYAGVGQWLGALGSLLAAITALWIATTDRRRAETVREAEQRDRNADLLREAGLVRVRFEEVPRLERLSGRAFGETGIGIGNRRADPIFDVELYTVAINGEDFRFDVDTISVAGGAATRGTLAHRVIESHQELLLFAEIPPHNGETFAVVRYTDQRGRRWQVDTSGAVAKVDADGGAPAGVTATAPAG